MAIIDEDKCSFSARKQMQQLIEDDLTTTPLSTALVRTPSSSQPEHTPVPSKPLLPDDCFATTPTGKQWPDVYSLPPLPSRLWDDLQNAESLVEADDSSLRKLIQIVFEDMSQYTLQVNPYFL